jgi:hypothetical protein
MNSLTRTVVRSRSASAARSAAMSSRDERSSTVRPPRRTGPRMRFMVLEMFAVTAS